MYTTVIKVNSYPPQYMTVGNETMRRAASGAFVTIYNTDPFERRSTPWIWDGINLKTEYGVNLVSYSVGTPVPMIKTIQVPGRPGQLDATLALNGRVNYISRPVSARFHVRNNPYERWHPLLSKLLKLFNGTEIRMSFSTDPGWYYKGRFILTPEKTGEVNSYFTLSCEEAFPYKLTLSETDWHIRESHHFNLEGHDYNSALKVNATAEMTMTLNGVTALITAGENLLREFRLAPGENYGQIDGTGYVSVRYESGVL